VKTRLSTVAGFLTAATLLSGSAFAFAPEFTGDIPTVIITDRITDSVLTDLFDAPAGAAGIAPRASSAFLFRYDNALDVTGIVDVKDAGSLANVKVVFTEFTDESDLTPNTVKTLSINGKVAVDDFPLVAADFDSSVAFDLSDPLLDFRNIDFSPGTGLGPFDNIGDVTGDDILATWPQSRIVTMHLGSDNFTDRGSASDLSFMVVTDLDDNDRLTNPELTEIWEVLTASGGANDGNFDGYTVTPNTLIPVVNPNGAWTAGGSYNITASNLNGMAVTPSVTLTDGVASPITAGATAVTLNTAASSNVAQRGILSLQESAVVAMDSGKLYRIRMNAALSTAVQNSDFYLQAGSVVTTGAVTAGFKDAAGYSATTLSLPGLTTTAADVDAYILPKSSMIADYNDIRVQLVDYNLTAGAAMTVNGFEVSVADGGLADLGSGTTLLNLGGAVTPATGEVAPPVGQTAFAAGTTVGESVTASITKANAAMSSTAAVTAAALTSIIDGPNSDFYWDYQQFEVVQDIGTSGLDLDTLETGLTTDPNKLYVMSVYAKTSNPGSLMPSLIPYALYDYTGLAGVMYTVGDSNSTAPSLTPDPFTQLAAQDKEYTAVFSPQTPNLEAKTQLGVQLYYTSVPPAAGATISITRIVLTEYDVK
jgi:hypothetical protein